MSYAIREMTLRVGWGFRCECQLCELDRADNHTARAALMDNQYPRIKHDGEALIKFIDDLERTYAKGRTLKPDLAIVYNQLMQCVQIGKLKRFEVSVEIADMQRRY